MLDNPELADERMIKTKLKEFVLLMTKSQNAPSQSDFLSALFKPLDIEFKSTIQHNIYSNLSIDELAKLCHLSTSSFKSGVFYGSIAGKLTGRLIDQSILFDDLNNPTYQDNVNAAIHRFIK